MSGNMTEDMGTSENTRTRERTTVQGRPSFDDRQKSQKDSANRRHHHSSSTSQSVGGSWVMGVVKKVWKSGSPVDSLAGSSQQPNTERDASLQPGDEALLPQATVKANSGDLEDRIHLEDTEYLRQIRQKEAQIAQMDVKYSQLSQESTATIQQLEDELNRQNKDGEQQEARLRQQDAIIRDLQDNLAQMQDKHQQLENIVVARQENALQLLVANKRYTPKEDRLIRDDLSKLGDKIRSWARKYSVTSFAQLEGVPESEKDMMIKELSGYCIQRDWDSMMRDISISQDKIPVVILQALLAKDVFGSMFIDPFFAFKKIEGDHTIPASREMREIYSLMAKVDAAEAHIWRSQTIRNLSIATQPNVESFLQERIRRLSSKFMTNFLSSSARTLLRQVKNNGDPNQRVRELESLYNGAAQLALSLWSQRAYMSCQSQKDLPVFTIANPKMSAHRLHQLDEDDSKLDGKRVVLFVQPAILAFGSENAEHYNRHKVWAPAVVLVDEKQSLGSPLREKHI